ncbi:MAG: hypothetical protein ABJY83_00600 [Roseibium sp.]
MAKPMHATARDYRGTASPSAAEDTEQTPAQREAASFLLVKNILFWGSAALTCFGLYIAGSFLLG